MVTPRDSAKAKFLRADLADDPDRFLDFLRMWIFLTPVAGKDARLERLLSFRLWWPQYSPRPVKLRFYFVEDTPGYHPFIERIAEGYIVHDESDQMGSLFVRREPIPEPPPDRDPARLCSRLGRLETAEEEEGGLLWARNPVLPLLRERQLPILNSGESHGGLLFPPGTPPEVRDFILNPCWWPLHSGPDAIRIRIDYAGAAQPLRGYLFRDGPGLIYIRKARRPGGDDLLDFADIAGLSASDFSRYRRFGKVALQPARKPNGGARRPPRPKRRRV